MNTDLARIMIARADADELPPDHELRTLAQAFDKATDALNSADGNHDMRAFLGAWSRARACWSRYAGVPSSASRSF